MVDKAIVGIAVVVVVILGVVLLFTAGSSKTQTSATTSVSYSINNTLTTQATTTIQQLVVPPSIANASVAAQLIAKPSVASIFGSGGSYGAYQRTTSIQLQSVLPQQFAPYSISGEYNMTYNVSTSSTTSNVIVEVIFATKSAKSMYGFLLSNYPYFNTTILKTQGARNIQSAINQTISGMTYSYSSFALSAPATNSSANTINAGKYALQVIFGHTNSSVVVLSVFQSNSTTSANTTQLASLAAQNLK